MRLLDKLTMGAQQPRGLCNASSPPDYDNIRWGGGVLAGGLRMPTEAGPGTLALKKETDLGSISGTVTLLPNQAMSSLITATPTANVTLKWAATYPGLVVQIANLAASGSGFTITAEVAGNTTNTVVIGPGTTVQIVHDGKLGGIIAGGAGTSTQSYTGTADAVVFPAQVNVAIFTSTGPDAATLAVPGAGDVGKILYLVNSNTAQTTVTTTANKILNGTASTYDTLTAPAHAGAVAMLVASNGFWNVGVLGTGTWVLSAV